MTNRLKILMISAEATPFAKVGGVADVVGSFPKALSQMGHDVRIVIPGYSRITQNRLDIKETGITLNVPVRNGMVPSHVQTSFLPNSNVPVYFVGENNLFGRDEMYGYPDDMYRFGFFGRAIPELINALNWMPDIVHGHDWQSAPAIMWFDTAGRSSEQFREINTVFTIHNLSHKGMFDRDLLNYMHLQSDPLPYESHDQIVLVARGVHHADRITTVSPTYAEEIQTELGGAGLHELMRQRRYDLTGIMNGLDHELWNPRTDPRLRHHYNMDDLSGKAELKKMLQEKAGLPVRDDVPLLGMVSRLDDQKGLQITAPVINRLLSGEMGAVQFVLLGRGSQRYEQFFRGLAQFYPDNMGLFLSYDEDLAPLIYAGSDMYLMPSLFEPCGLGQLIAMRYGTVPIVRATGGMRDSIEHGRTGFIFLNYDVIEFWKAVSAGVYVYHNDQELWQYIQRQGLERDFSWDKQSEQYINIYRSLIEKE